MLLTNRYREQARSHSFYLTDLGRHLASIHQRLSSTVHLPPS
ncbi:protein of unknown function [Pseudomonas mediterranea]